MTPIGVYALLVVLTAVLSTLRPKPVRVDLGLVLLVHLALLTAEIIRLGLGPESLGHRSIGVLALATVASAAVRHWWYVSPSDVETVRAAVEDSLVRLRFEARAVEDGWSVRSGEVEGRVTLRALPGPGVGLRLSSESTSPKFELLRGLLAKRFGRLVPRPRIRLRRGA